MHREMSNGNRPFSEPLASIRASMGGDWLGHEQGWVGAILGATLPGKFCNQGRHHQWKLLLPALFCRAERRHASNRHGTSKHGAQQPSSQEREGVRVKLFSLTRTAVTRETLIPSCQPAAEAEDCRCRRRQGALTDDRYCAMYCTVTTMCKLYLYRSSMVI